MAETPDKFQVLPLTLEGRHVRLEPLEQKHARELLDAGRDESIWSYMPYKIGTTLEDAEDWIVKALAPVAEGREVAFAIIDLASGNAVGSTRYLEIRPVHRSLEIGWTWLCPEVQRSAVNTECKYLLLSHAFEGLGAFRVQLKTDSRNMVSQKAIERIGGVREGVLHKDKRIWDGYIRDTAYFSIVAREWPAVKQKLVARLGEA